MTLQLTIAVSPRLALQFTTAVSPCLILGLLLQFNPVQPFSLLMHFHPDYSSRLLLQSHPEWLFSLLMQSHSVLPCSLLLQSHPDWPFSLLRNYKSRFSLQINTAVSPCLAHQLTTATDWCFRIKSKSSLYTERQHFFFVLCYTQIRSEISLYENSLTPTT